MMCPPSDPRCLCLGSCVRSKNYFRVFTLHHLEKGTVRGSGEGSPEGLGVGLGLPGDSQPCRHVALTPLPMC